MKYRIPILITLFLAWLPAPLKSLAADRYEPLPPALDGSMMPYDFRACTQPPVLNDSLRPVYAAYVARHGSRYLSGPAKMKPVMSALEKGRNTGTLSATGEAFLKLMLLVEKTNEDNWGDLSPIGITEERLLAKRMHSILPQLSRPRAKINAISSFIPRSVMTMYQFTNQLIRMNDSVATLTDEGPQFSTLMCCFMADKPYAQYRKNGNWQAVYDDFVERHVSPDPARRLFTTTDLSDSKLRKLTMDMYEILKANRAASLPAPTTQWMSRREYSDCWRASNLSHYLRNSITPLSDLAAQATAPLLKRIIADTDDAIAAYDCNLPHDDLNGYFGHCETLLPLLSLIRIPVCNELPHNYEDLDSSWKIQEISPLAANLLILIVEGPSGTKYAAMQLNGKTVKPMRGAPDIIEWTKLRTYWQSRLPH